MIKHSQTFLLKSLQFFFNFCLSSGIYPNSWANGYITAIHKGNDPTDLKSTKHANNLPSFELQYLLIRQLIANI
jgi:hypothetical protein